MAKVGLLFGSFNPVHKGHLEIARAGLGKAGCDEVWWLIQERNVHKPQNDLAPLEDRIAMVRLATKSNDRFRVVISRADSLMPMLDNLGKYYKDHKFVLLMGQDLVESLSKWKDHHKIIDRYQIYGYNRAKDDVSSDKIRQLIGSKKPVTGMVTASVNNYLRKHQLYTKA